MKLSIITVCYNDLCGLKRTFESIKQYLHLVQWVVIDGASSDGTPEFLQSLKQDDFNFLSEPDAGIYDAMNKGVVLSENEYVVFLNAGDKLHSSFKMNEIKSVLNTGHDLICFNADFLYPNGNVIAKPARGFEYVKHSIPANHQCILFKRACVIRFPYSLDYKVCGDYELVSNLWNIHSSYKTVNKTFAEFEIGGISTLKPHILIKEAYLIQKDILKLNIIRRLGSAFVRIISLSFNYFRFKIK